MNCASFCASRKSISKRPSASIGIDARSPRSRRTAVRPVGQRRHGRAVAAGRQLAPRGLHGVADGRQRGREGSRRVGAGERREARQARVDAIERLFLGAIDAIGQDGVAQAIRPDATELDFAVGQGQQLRHALTLVHAPGFGGNLVAGSPEHRIVVGAALEHQRRLRALACELRRARPASASTRPGPAESRRVVVLLRLPRPKTLCDLLREPMRDRQPRETPRASDARRSGDAGRRHRHRRRTRR